MNIVTASADSLNNLFSALKRLKAAQSWQSALSPPYSLSKQKGQEEEKLPPSTQFFLPNEWFLREPALIGTSEKSYSG